MVVARKTSSPCQDGAGTSVTGSSHTQRPVSAARSANACGPVPDAQPVTTTSTCPSKSVGERFQVRCRPATGAVPVAPVSAASQFCPDATGWFA